MSQDVLITGVPGSGKSTVCSALQDRGYTAFDIESRDRLFTMIDTETGEQFEDFDPRDVSALKRSKYVCDTDALRELMDRPEDEDVVFYCGNATDHTELLPLFDQVFLLKPSEYELRARLRTRETSSMGHDHNVRAWILRWKEEEEEDIRDRGATVINADPPVEDVVTQILTELGHTT